MTKFFQCNKDYKKTAFLNWRTSSSEDISNLLVLADGFLSSAIKLCQSCIVYNKDKKADILIFPILHNANHGIELYLKSMIWTINKLQNNNLEFKTSHDIQQMYSALRSLILSYKNNDWLKHFDEQNLILAQYINELFAQISSYGKGDNMDFSRYPITNKYENHFYIDKLDNVEIDLVNFKKQLIKIKLSLDERASYFFFQELKKEQ